MVDRGASRLILHTNLHVYTLPSNGAPAWLPIEAGLPNPRFLVSLASDREGRAYLVDIAGRVYRLASGGTQWFAADGGLPGGTPTAVWADQSLPGRLLVATAADVSNPNLGQGPLWRSLDGGTTWNASATGYEAVQVNALAVDPTSPGVLLAATDNDGVQRSTDGGTTWTATVGIVDQPRAVALDPRGTGIALAALNGIGVARSVDGGLTWGAPEPGSPSNADDLVVDADGTAFAAQSSGLRSIDGGATWTPLPSDGLTVPASIRRVYPDPTTRGAIWAIGTLGGIFFLPAGASAWIQRGTEVPEPGALAFDAVRPATIYAASFGGGVWRSDDAGEHWERASSGITSAWVPDVVADRRLGDVAYVVTDTGAFRTADRGVSWSAIATPASALHRLWADTDGHTLHGATFSEGLLSLTQSAPPVLLAAPSIAGSPRLRTVLQASVGGWDGAPAPDFTLVWERCDRRLRRCKPVKGATGIEYRLKKADRRRRIRLNVTASNFRGAATALSEATEAVRPRR